MKKEYEKQNKPDCVAAPSGCLDGSEVNHIYTGYSNKNIKIGNEHITVSACCETHHKNRGSRGSMADFIREFGRSYL